MHKSTLYNLQLIYSKYIINYTIR